MCLSRDCVTQRHGTLNTVDGIYNSLSATAKNGLTLQTTTGATGYAGTINLGVVVG